MRLLYKPLGIIFGLIAARIGKSLFTAMWARIDDAPPPQPTTRDTTLSKAVGAKALEAATMAGVGAAADRAGARVFHHLFGIWPGPKPEPDDE
jgi:hypothetical protein